MEIFYEMLLRNLHLKKGNINKLQYYNYTLVLKLKREGKHM